MKPAPPPAAAAPHPPAASPASSGSAGPVWLGPLLDRLLPDAATRERFHRAESQFPQAGVRDLEVVRLDEAPLLEQCFDRLRWGGQLVCVATDHAAMSRWLDDAGQRSEWRVEGVVNSLPIDRGAKIVRWLPGGLRRRWLTRTWHYAVIRKILLDPPTRLTARHSYDVRLVPADRTIDPQDVTDGYVVLKRVPTHAQAVSRLVQTCPDVPADRLDQIAHKLVDKVFPVFLTREAAFLKLLQRDLPPALRPRTPRVLSLELDHRGMVRQMTMRWLRQGGPTLSQSEFAHQAAELLAALYDHAGIMHLDLRLDNLLITEAGVGVVDFGSAMRAGEDFSANPMLQRLIREMLEASQITSDLKRQRRKGLIRSPLFKGLPFPPTPAFDLYALTTNLTRPHDHAEFKGLVAHDRTSDEGRWFSQLRRRILQPAPGEPRIESAASLRREVETYVDRSFLPRRQPKPAAAPQPVILTGSTMPRPASVAQASSM